MHYVCGECGSDDATAEGCRKCYRAAFDMDTPLGQQQMADYRALCIERDATKAGLWFPAIYVLGLIAVCTVIWLLFPKLWYEPSDLVANLILVMAQAAAGGGAYLIYRWRTTRAQRALDGQLRAPGGRVRDLAKHAWPWIGLGGLALAAVARVPLSDLLPTCLLLALVAGVLERHVGAPATVGVVGGALLVRLLAGLLDPGLLSQWPVAHAVQVTLGAALVVVAPGAAFWPSGDPRLPLRVAVAVPLLLGIDLLIHALATPGFTFAAPAASAAAGLVAGTLLRLLRGAPGAATPASRRASSAGRLPASPPLP